MLDQKLFGQKLRNHRKKLGMTQESVSEIIGVSPQAISKWEAGDCLPDCFNLKTISGVYKISLDVLLETESAGDIEAVASKIEQIGTEYIWANANSRRYEANPRYELGEDLWKMWKGLYFAEVGNHELQEQSKQQGNLRICGQYGMKIWDDEGIACVVKSSLIKGLDSAVPRTQEVFQALCTEEGQRLIAALDCQVPVPKDELIARTNIEIYRLNELLLMLMENQIIEFVADHRKSEIVGYKISGHCGIVAYLVLAAMSILEKKRYSVSEYYCNDIAQ